MESIRPIGGGITLIALSSVLIVLTIIFVALRLYSRHAIRRTLELNDYSIIIGALLAITNAVLTILAVIYGGVGHQQLEVMHLYPQLAKITLGLALIWTLANTFVKLSIVHLYIVIFHTNKRFRLATYGVIFLICGYCITNIVLNLITCKPIAFNWDKTIPGGTCTTAQAPYLSSAIINMIVDVIIFALPLPVLWGLQMNMKKKISLVIIFALGFLICIISAVRIESIANLDFLNFSYSVVHDGIYSVLEPCCGVINACLPVIQPVATKLAQSRIFSSLRSSLRGTSRGSSVKRDISENANVTVGGSGQKKRYQKFDEEGNSMATDDEYPLTSIPVTGANSNFRTDERW